MVDYYGQTVDYLEDFEDATLNAALTEADDGAFLTVSSGTQYKNGTKAMAIDTTSQNQDAVVFDAIADDNLSVGFWFRGATLTNTGYYGILNIVDASYAYIATLAYGYDGSVIRIWSAEASSGVEVSANTWYWITYKHVRNGTSTLRVYSAAGSQVGSDVTFTAANTAVAYIYVGCANPWSSASGVWYWDDFILDSAGNFPLLGWSVGAPTLTQEGYRWRLDDGDQANATWAVAQDTGITAPANAIRRLRVLIDTSGDTNATQFQLEYKEANDANYTKVS